MSKRKYINCTEVFKNGRKYWRARLIFPFDSELGCKPAPKDFYAKTASEANRLRQEYKPSKETLDLGTSLLQYITNTFIPEQQLKAENGGISWRYFKQRETRLNKYLLDPKCEELLDLKVRFARLGVLAPIHVDEFFRAIQKARVSHEEQHRVMDDLKQCLKSARHKIPYPAQSYFEDLEIPPLPERLRPIVMFDPDLIFTTLTNANFPICDRALVAFEFIMQCRPQEIFALTWDDLDLQNGAVTFWKKVAETKDGWQVVDGTKTGAKGVRTVALGEFLTNLLLQHKKTQGKVKGDWVFTTRQGDMIHKERWKDLWQQVRESLNLPKGPHFYSLKHLGNSYVLANGGNAQAQGEKMGHTSDRMAKKVYRQIMSSEKLISVKLFDSKLTGSDIIPQLTGETV